jgi:RNA polymerase sigma-70 factor (ECF subfamily)
MELYRRYGPALLRKAERMLQDRDEAKDVVQGLFVDLLQRAADAAPARDVDLPYLYRAVTHRCLNHLRDRRNQGRLLSDADEALRGVARTRLDERVVDRRLLARLADRVDGQAWEILVYHFVDDMTQDEIASLLGVSRKTIVRRLATIRDEARRLAEAEAEPPVGPTGGAS